jgi:hypothetical protein
MIDYRHPNFTHFTNGRWATPPPRRGWIRVRVSIMGSTTDRNVGESQSFLVLIVPIISTAPVSTPRVDKLSRSHAPAPASARARCRRSRAPNAPAPPDTSPSAAGRAPTRARTAGGRTGVAALLHLRDTQRSAHNAFCVEARVNSQSSTSAALPWGAHRIRIRVRGQIMGSPKCRNIGESQPACLAMINAGV